MYLLLLYKQQQKY